MTEGPYRDLGSGFARLTGVEGVRRAPSHIETVEDALLELVRNSVDAGASNVYVATALRARRYRELVVIDDGSGIPEPYRERIFEPGVTTRHLAPSRTANRAHGAGLSLHHIREAALSCDVASTGSPTSIRALFDTETLPERALQSGGKSSHHPRSNLRATLQSLAAEPGAPEIFYGSPASILVTLLNKRIIQRGVEIEELESWCGERMGESPSRRTLQRVLKGQVSPAERVGELRETESTGRGKQDDAAGVRGAGILSGGRTLVLDESDLSQIKGIIERAARESYLEVGEIRLDSSVGEITVKAKIYETEGEYDE